MLGTALKIVLENIAITDTMGRIQSGHDEEGDYEGMDPAVCHFMVPRTTVY